MARTNSEAWQRIQFEKEVLMKKPILLITAFYCLAIALTVRAEDGREKLPDVPTKGMVTMLDLGAKKCIPCKLMAPILEKLKKAYEGKASIVFIDVWEHQDQVKIHRLTAIPTQIFFDEHGKEVYRNVGFMSEEAILRQLEKMGVSQVKETGS